MRRKLGGNSLVEYALPMAVVFCLCGGALSVLNVQKAMPGFFARAGGFTTQNIKAGTYRVDMSTPDTLGVAGTGAEKLDENFVPVSPQQGGLRISDEQQHEKARRPGKQNDGKLNIYKKEFLEACKADADDCVPVYEDSEIYVPVYKTPNGELSLDDLTSDMRSEKKDNPFENARLNPLETSAAEDSEPPPDPQLEEP